MNDKSVRIGLDMMGGELSVSELMPGVHKAIKQQKNIHLHLFGDKNQIEKTIPDGKYHSHRLTVHHANSYIKMTEDPIASVKKKEDSSLILGLKALKEERIDGFFSPGNTGATLAASLLIIGRIKNIKRPAIACPLPTAYNTRVALFLDGGANVDCTPLYLNQFAHMGSIYYQNAFGETSPKVALLNVGEEPGKGNAASKIAYQELSNSSLNFIGNVEPKEFFNHHSDVAVCDGFMGNIFLKTAEGSVEQLSGDFKKRNEKKPHQNIGFFASLSTVSKCQKGDEC